MAKAKSSKSTTKKPKRNSAGKAPTKRVDTKQAQLIAMLQRPDGATIDEIVKKLEWQSHTVRGAIAGALKKRLNLKVESEKLEGRGRVYRIAA
jgi:predicted ArsR family transcriptional regulator